MKINDIILTENSNKLYEQVIKSPIFQNYYKHIIDNDENLKDNIDDDVNAFNALETFYKDNKILSHGTSRVNDVISFNYREGPKDTYPYVHEYINEQSIEEYGEPLRDLFFCYTNMVDATGYGIAQMIIPLGNYDIYYNPDVHDLATMYPISNETTMDEFLQNSEDENVQEELDILGDYVLYELKDNDLLDEFRSRKEGGYGVTNLILGAFSNYARTARTFDFDSQLMAKTIHGMIGDVVDKKLATRIAGLFKTFYDQVYKNTVVDIVDQYLKGIVHTNNIKEVDTKGGTVELMLKFDKAILIDTHHILELLRHYYENYYEN